MMRRALGVPFVPSVAEPPPGSPAPTRGSPCALPAAAGIATSIRPVTMLPVTCLLATPEVP